MEGHRIGVISDTHGILRPEVETVLKSCEMILHAGDIGKPEVLRRLRLIADTRAVKGNVDSGRKKEFHAREAESRNRGADPGIRAGQLQAGHEACTEELPENLPEELETEIFGFRIYMIHDKKQVRRDLTGVDFMVCGHSHKYEVGSFGKIPCLNPGSCGPRRFRLPVTMMVLTLYPAGHRLQTERIDCLGLPPIERGIPDAEAAGQDMYRLIRQIMKDVDAGKSMAETAARNQIDERFTEQVCRMYLTHPGIDVDGILDRMDGKR